MFNDDERYPIAKQAYLLIAFHPESDALGAAAEAAALARRFGESTGGMFNGVLMLARPTEGPDAVLTRWKRRAAAEGRRGAL